MPTPLQPFLAFLLSPTPRAHRFWFALSMALAACYALLVMQQAFAHPWMVQDDARQHVFWMQRFQNPGLFPQDLIADYFQSVAPWGYTQLYRLFAAIGIAPLLLSKLLPLAIGLVATAYGWQLCLALLPVPFAGFLSSLLLNQVLWAHDDVASATPRAFLAPLFLAFLYYLLRRSLLPCLVTIALEGLFYPQYVLVFAGILVLQVVEWQQGRLRLVKERQVYYFVGLGLLVALLVMLPFALSSSDYGPVIKAAEARTLPEFYPGGRSEFFSDNFWTYWVSDGRSGLLPMFRPLFLGVGLVLPLLLRFPDRLALVAQVSRGVGLLWRVAAAGLCWFVAAHALLFKLHLPSRYVTHTFRFALVYAAALSLVLLLEAGSRWLSQAKGASRLQRGLLWGLAIGMGLALLLYPVYAPNFPKPNYEQGKTPRLYHFLARQPQDSLIASVQKEADFIPTFASRSLFVGREYAIPYHKGYGDRFRQRAIAMIRAQYTLDAGELARFIQANGIDFWVLSRESFSPDFLHKTWIRQYPTAIAEAERNLQQGTPVLQQQIDRCTVLREDPLLVLRAACLLPAKTD